MSGRIQVPATSGLIRPRNFSVIALNSEVEEWCGENLTGRHWVTYGKWGSPDDLGLRALYNYQINFEVPNDAILFKLRWL